MAKRALVEDKEAIEARERRIAWTTDNFVIEALHALPPDVDGEEAGQVMFLGGMSVIAKGLVLLFPAADEKDLKGQVRRFLDTREPRVETALIDLALEVYKGLQE